MAFERGSRVLFLIPQFSPVVGGAETQAERLAHIIAARGHPVDVLTCAIPGAPPVEERDGVTVRRSIRVIRRRALWGATHYLGSEAFLRQRGGRYAAAVGFGLHPFHNPAVVSWGRRQRRPVLIRCECSGAFGDLVALRGMAAGGWVRSSLGGATRLIALTGVMRDELAAAGFPERRIVVIPNGVDLSLFRPAAPPTERGRDLVFVGRLAPQKGLPDLLAAFEALAAAYPGVNVRLFGEGPDRSALAALAAARGLGARVHFHGTVSAEAVRTALAEAAALVLPSLGEGLSCVLLEAMAMGCPVVATGIPANREALAEGESGLLVPPRDPAAFAAAIRRLLDDPGLAAAIGAGARRSALERFSLDAIADRYLALMAAGR